MNVDDTHGIIIPLIYPMDGFDVGGDKERFDSVLPELLCCCRTCCRTVVVLYETDKYKTAHRFPRS